MSNSRAYLRVGNNLHNDIGAGLTVNVLTADGGIHRLVSYTTLESIGSRTIIIEQPLGSCIGVKCFGLVDLYIEFQEYPHEKKRKAIRSNRRRRRKS